MKKVLIIVLMAMTLTSCATIFSGSKQNVVFSAPEGTRLYMDGIKIAEVPQGYDAVSVRLDRKISGSYMVAKKAGYNDTFFYIQTKVNGTVFINILMGPYMLIGGGIDLLTGAAAQYPNYIEIEMLPLEGTVSGQQTIDNILQL